MTARKKAKPAAAPQVILMPTGIILIRVGPDQARFDAFDLDPKQIPGLLRGIADSYEVDLIKQEGKNARTSD